MTSEKREYKILSIDAWAGDEKHCWEWNNWHTVGTLESLPDEDKVIDVLIEEGLLKDAAKDLCLVEDDQYNLLVLEKENSRPLYAIEYGNEG